MPPPHCADQALSSREHLALAEFNRSRLRPERPSPTWLGGLIAELELRKQEFAFLQAAREQVAEAAQLAPEDPEEFLHWFEDLRLHGPGQQDPLFTFLAEQADCEQMRWFIAQEAAGEAGFDDLVALSQIALPARAKMEMARNFWDEMGRGVHANMHGQLLNQVVKDLHIQQLRATILLEPLMLSNLMMGLACCRAYAYQAIGALGVIELTAPDRVALVAQGLRRLGFSNATCRYYDVHAVLDVQHSRSWNREVITSLIQEDASISQAIAEGAVMRLQAGACCFARYREHFHLEAVTT